MHFLMEPGPGPGPGPALAMVSRGERERERERDELVAHSEWQEALKASASDAASGISFPCTLARCSFQEDK